MRDPFACFDKEPLPSKFTITLVYHRELKSENCIIPLKIVFVNSSHPDGQAIWQLNIHTLPSKHNFNQQSKIINKCMQLVILNTYNRSEHLNGRFQETCNSSPRKVTLLIWKGREEDLIWTQHALKAEKTLVLQIFTIFLYLQRFFLSLDIKVLLKTLGKRRAIC